MKISVIFMNEKFCQFYDVIFFCRPLRVSHPTVGIESSKVQDEKNEQLVTYTVGFKRKGYK